MLRKTWIWQVRGTTSGKAERSNLKSLPCAPTSFACQINQNMRRACTGLEQSVCTWEYKCAKRIVQQPLLAVRDSSSSYAKRSLTGSGLRISAMALDHLHCNTCQQQGHVMPNSDGARRIYQSSLNHSGGSRRTSAAECFDIIESDAALD